MPPSELARIYDAHAGALAAFLRRFTRDDADAKDVLQEVFHRLADAATTLEHVGNLRGYLLRIAHHLAVDLIRRRDRRDRAHAAQAESGDETPRTMGSGADPDAGAMGTAIDAALALLPPDQRAVVQLKLQEGWTFERIAEVLEISPHTAASRYRYGVDKLRAQLRPLYEETQGCSGGSAAPTSP